MSDRIFLQTLRCPECGVNGDYWINMENIVCDFCVADIKINGEYQI